MSDLSGEIATEAGEDIECFCFSDDLLDSPLISSFVAVLGPDA